MYTIIRTAGEPICLFYTTPLDSWFIKTTAYRERMMELNATINWKPAATDPEDLETGWKTWWIELLSRSRFWGIPLPNLGDRR